MTRVDRMSSSPELAGDNSCRCSHGDQTKARRITAGLLPCIIVAAICAALGPRTVLAAPGDCSDSACVGFVVLITGHGSWVLKDSALRTGDGVHAGDTIRLQGTDTADAVIKIAFVDGTVVFRDCNKTDQNKCHETLEIGARTIQPSRITGQTPSSRLSAVWGRLTKGPERPTVVFAISRGSAGDELAEESVLRLEGGIPDLAPALKSIAKGPLTAFLLPVNATTSPQEQQAVRVPPGIQLTVRWDPPKASISGPTVAPGPYFLKVSEDAMPVLVLIAPPAEAARLSTDFEEARRLSANWPPEMGDEARHNFLSFVLLALSRDGENGR